MDCGVGGMNTGGRLQRLGLLPGGRARGRGGEVRVALVLLHRGLRVVHHAAVRGGLLRGDGGGRGHGGDAQVEVGLFNFCVCRSVRACTGFDEGVCYT